MSSRTFAFHDDLGELHGITVVVETHGERIWVGRCHEQSPAGILLKDADCHDGDGEGRAAWLKKANDVGVWPNHKNAMVAAADVKLVRVLG